MGLLDKLFGSKKDIDARPAHQYQTVTGYRPVFESWSGHMYEQQLVRSVIERIAVACSKLEPEVVGSAKPRIARAFKTSPSDMMTWPRFLARCATIYFNDNNLFVVPQYKDGTDTVIGVYPLKPASVEVVEYRGEPWFRFYVGSGKTVALPVRSVCLITRFQYESDFFGEKNNLDSTLDLMKMQEQADKEAIRAGSRIQWIGELGSQVRPEDIKKKREKFYEDNFGDPNGTNLLFYDQSFRDVKQVDPKNWTVPVEEMRRIEDSVFRYFGVNDKILTNSYDENEWGAFYEGLVEPFAVQLGEGLSHMLYTMRERPANRIEFSSSRLQYASNSSKRNMNRDMLDRGVMTINQALDVLQLPEVPDGDVRILRGEYKVGHTLDEIFEVQNAEVKIAGGEVPGVENADIDRDGADADLDRGDSEGYGSGDDFDSGTGGRRAD